MELPVYQADAFTGAVFGGNPAAVIPLQQWLPDWLLQQIAVENNLSETAFVVPAEQGFQLRWFTPAAEVDLCGHATLAAAHIAFTRLGWPMTQIQFQTRSGVLTVTRQGDYYEMDFPGSWPQPVTAPDGLAEALGATPQQVLAAYDYIVVLSSADEVRALQPDLQVLAHFDKRGLLATAPGDEPGIDFVSRCFFPGLNVPEDPVTGSAHCELAPYWAEQLDRQQLVGQQVSARGGTIHCQIKGERVRLRGQVADYLQGFITIPDPD